MSPGHYVVNLDAPANQRWSNVTTAFKSKAHLITEYLDEQIPPSVRPLMNWLAGKLIVR